MNTVTIPKKLAKKGDLIILPRREYEALLKFRKIGEFSPSSAQKKALEEAESNLKQGKTLSYNELTQKLRFTNRP